MSTKYIAKCFKCLQFYEDANQRDSYKDSLIKQFVSDSKTGRVIRCCPYCDTYDYRMCDLKETIMKRNLFWR